MVFLRWNSQQMLKRLLILAKSQCTVCGQKRESSQPLISLLLRMRSSNLARRRSMKAKIRSSTKFSRQRGWIIPWTSLSLLRPWTIAGDTLKIPSGNFPRMSSSFKTHKNTRCSSLKHSSTTCKRPWATTPSSHNDFTTLLLYYLY